MLPPSNADPSPDQSECDPLELLLADALAILEEEGREGLERFLQSHQEHSEPLRAALRELDHIDFLQPPKDEVPPQIGDFLLKEQLGSGGMGVVYLAQQQSLGREVALKMVRPELLLFEGARERFRREIDAVARLEHPAIIPIIASGTQNDIPYYAMPRLRGCDGERVVQQLATRNLDALRGSDLLAIVSAGSDPSATDPVFADGYWQSVLRLIHQAALGIQHAHLRGVLHRDIKPSNIFFTQTGQAVVLDFGLARASEDPRMTRSGTSAGSPAYMAPEQVRGEPADERTDIYALAATMHCMLSMQTPFETDSLEGLSTRILNGDRRELRIAVPTEVQIVLACAMDVDRARRYASCQHFANDLLAAIEGRSISARRLPTSVRISRLVRRHRTIAVAAGMALAFVFLVPALLLWQQSEASAAMRKQVEKTNSANSQLEQSNQELGKTNDQLQATIEQRDQVNAELAQLNEQLQEQVTRSDRNARTSLDAIRSLLIGTNTRDLRRNRAATPILARMLSDAMDLFEGLDISSELEAEVLLLKLDTLSGLVDLLSAMGHNEEAIAACDKSIALTNSGPLNDKLRMLRAIAMSHKASVHMDQLMHDGVPELLQSSREVFEQLLANQDFRDRCKLQLSMSEGIVAALAMREGKLAEAEVAMRRAIDWAQQMDEEIRPLSVHGTNRLNLARLLKSSKRYDEALAEIEQQLVDLSGVTAADDNSWPVPRYVRAMGHNERFRLLQLQGKHDEAIAAAPQAIAQLDELIRDYKNIPELPRLRCTIYGNLGVIYYERKDWPEAIRLSDLAARDATTALSMAPDERQALQFQATHQRVLVVSLRKAGQWQRLEQEALKLGQMSIPAMWREGAARELLRCSARVDATRAAELREQAILWLVAANQAGRRIDVAGELCDAIRADERIQALNK